MWICTGGSMDRASDSGSEGWGFESLPVCHGKETVKTVRNQQKLLFCGAASAGFVYKDNGLKCRGLTIQDVFVPIQDGLPFSIHRPV